MFPTQCGSMYQEAGAELWIWGKKKKKSTSIEFLKKAPNDQSYKWAFWYIFIPILLPESIGYFCSCSLNSKVAIMLSEKENKL